MVLVDHKQFPYVSNTLDLFYVLDDDPNVVKILYKYPMGEKNLWIISKQSPVDAYLIETTCEWNGSNLKWILLNGFNCNWRISFCLANNNGFFAGGNFFGKIFENIDYISEKKDFNGFI